MSAAPIWQAAGWVAAGLNVWGNLELTTKSVRGWVIRLVTNACWLPYGVATGAWAITANHLLFVGINAYGWWKWKHEAKTAARPCYCPPGECPACERGFIAAATQRTP